MFNSTVEKGLHARFLIKTALCVGTQIRDIYIQNITINQMLTEVLK